MLFWALGNTDFVVSPRRRFVVHTGRAFAKDFYPTDTYSESLSSCNFGSTLGLLEVRLVRGLGAGQVRAKLEILFSAQRKFCES